MRRRREEDPGIEGPDLLQVKADQGLLGKEGRSALWTQPSTGIQVQGPSTVGLTESVPVVLETIEESVTKHFSMRRTLQ